MTGGCRTAPITSPTLERPGAYTAADFYTLITEPEDGMAPVLNLIETANKSIDLVAYELEDVQIEKALAAAHKRGVTVRVLLNQGYYNEQAEDNQAAYQYLFARGVVVHWSPNYFALTHQKTLLIDGNQALIMTFNFKPQYYTADRDFGILDKNPLDVAAIESVFEDDWQGRRSKPAHVDNLVWSPGAETAILDLIRNSQKSLRIENGEMADADVENALIAAARRGVKVEVVMTDSSQWANDFKTLRSGGINIRTYAPQAPLYIHAKIILADGTTALIGSQNFSNTSLNDNRELGIRLTEPAILTALDRTFQKDWEGADH